jgi:hypothetical protein
MSKQTAVQWLKEQIECFGNKHELQMSWATLDELLEQAKQMEKEQHEITYNQILMSNFQTFNDYYNETYGGHLIDHISDVSKMVGGQDE